VSEAIRDRAARADRPDPREGPDQRWSGLLGEPGLPERRIATAGPDETARLGALLAGRAAAGDVLCLWGDLGAGKTVFASGFGAGLGVSETITSPTFVLMAEYAGRLPLFHLDLYRLADETDAFESGLIDDRQAAGVTLIEWPDRMASTLPTRRLDVVIESEDDDVRRITLRAGATDLVRYLDAVA